MWIDLQRHLFVLSRLRWPCAVDGMLDSSYCLTNQLSFHLSFSVSVFLSAHLSAGQSLVSVFLFLFVPSPLPTCPHYTQKNAYDSHQAVMDVMLHELFTLIVHVPFSTAPVSNQLIRPHTQHYQYAADLVRLVVHVSFSWVRLFRLQADFRIQISFRNQ